MSELNNGFMIINGHVVVLGKQPTLHLTQAEYDSLSDEKKNDGTIYFITDVDGEIEINDGVISETSTWSSDKIESALQTSKDVAQTNITMNETYAISSSGGHGCRYVVRNGICYVNMDLRMIANGQICTLPKPLMTVINIPMPIFMTDVTDIGTGNGILIIESTGSARTLGAKLSQTRYMLNFSYPVAE